MTTLESKYQAMEAAAIAALRRPHEVANDPSADRPTLTLLIWRFPSFAPYRSWALLQCGGDAAPRFLIRRTTWDRPRDYERAHHPLQQASFLMDPRPSPTGEVREVRLAAEVSERIVERAARLAEPAVGTERSTTIDGVAAGIATRNRPAGIAWNGDGPSAWIEFTKEAESLRDELEAAVSVENASRRRLCDRAERHPGGDRMGDGHAEVP